MSAGAALAAALLVTLSLPRAQEPGAAQVVPIQVTGDPAARFTLVVLGDGYTAQELPKFRTHLDRHLNVLWSIEPFRSYRSYINVYAVEIVSAESGITCDPEVREKRNTPLGANFTGGCTNPNARGILVNQNAARAYAAKATPHVDQILVIANTDTYGGIGGGVATTSGGNSLGPLITPHELGHSLGRLQDEYTYSARGKPGGPYTGEEPASIHHTLLATEQMRDEQKKWFRWLGEASEAGGTIGRFEGGQSRTTGIWRPSKHSMMISVGYYFDQVSRERMTERISAQVQLIAASRPTDTPVGINEVIWIEPAHPVYHELEITWSIDGTPLQLPGNSPVFNLGATELPAGVEEVAVRVVDPTPFVRDPAIREKVLTAARVWKLDVKASAPAGPSPTFVRSTSTDRPVGGAAVVYVVTTYPPGGSEVQWRLNGAVVKTPPLSRTVDLAAQKLAAGTHKLTATLLVPASRGPSPTLAWTVDNTPPTVSYVLATPVASVTSADGVQHAFVRDEFTMHLDPRDDQRGHVVAEFRVNGDGWHHYYGWPDAPPGTPYRFTPRGTTIKELVYGSLSSEGLSPQPWEPREPGWGAHRIEYRAIDAAGNLGDARSFGVTIMPSPSCTRTVTGRHDGALAVDAGVLCLDGATITGAVTVASGAALVATRSALDGGLSATGAETIELIASTAGADVTLTGLSRRAVIFGGAYAAGLTLRDSRSPAVPLIVGTTVKGAVVCTGNATGPSNGGTPNTFARGATGQCAAL